MRSCGWKTSPQELPGHLAADFPRPVIFLDAVVDNIASVEQKKITLTGRYNRFRTRSRRTPWPSSNRPLKSNRRNVRTWKAYIDQVQRPRPPRRASAELIKGPGTQEELSAAHVESPSDFASVVGEESPARCWTSRSSPGYVRQKHPREGHAAAHSVARIVARPNGAGKSTLINGTVSDGA